MTSARSAADVLREMRDLLAVPERWTQGTWARLADGSEVHGWNQGAERWCVAGAGQCVDPYNHELRREALYLIESLIRPTWVCIGDWNDAPERTHAEVLDLLDRAIEVAEGAR